MSHTSKATIRHFKAMRFARSEASADSLARFIRLARKRKTVLGLALLAYLGVLLVRFLT